VARGPDQRHPVKAKPLRGGACRASLDRLSLAQQGALQAGKADWERGRSNADAESWRRFRPKKNLQNDL